ncbi:MAG: indole-3-glycerol phosphate synthase TrpC [Alphaproteobacteria bacterium]
MSDILARICAAKRDHVAQCKAARPLAIVERQAAEAGPTRGFAKRLRQKVAAGQIGLIAEIKKASPSKGLIRDDFDPVDLAKAYASGGATCISVLTDQPYFQGADEYLTAARAATDLPALRKDFMVDPYQIHEARTLGADCILLIMAALSDHEATGFAALAADLSMDVLVEVHNRRELDRALNLDAPLLGINNRDLKTLTVDIATTEDLAPHIPPDKILISESGLKDSNDLLRMQNAGAHCFLIGEQFMRQPDVAAAVRELLMDTAQHV